MSLHGGHAYPHDPQHGVGKGMSEPGLKDGGGPMGYDVVDRKIAEVRRGRGVVRLHCLLPGEPHFVVCMVCQVRRRFPALLSR